MAVGIANMFDLTGKSTGSYLAGGSFREKYGQSLFTDEQKRLRQYSDQDIARTSNANLQRLERIKSEAVEMSDGELVAGTGNGRNRVAKSVEQQFQPLDNNVAFRLQAGALRA